MTTCLPCRRRRSSHTILAGRTVAEKRGVRVEKE